MSDTDDAAENPLPGAVGALVQVGNSQPFRDLFGPTAKALGEYWGEVTEEKIQRWRQKKTDNIRRHVSAVMEETGDEVVEFDEQRAVLQSAWMEQAENVDPEKDEELASLWQGLLHNIMSGGQDSHLMIETLKSLNSREAQVILNHGRRRIPASRDTIIYRGLESKGLMIKFGMFEGYRMNSFIYLPFVVAATMLVMTFLTYFYPEVRSESINIFGQDTSRIILVSLISVFLVSIGYLWIHSLRYYLTPVGARLRYYGLKYLRHAKQDS